MILIAAGFLIVAYANFATAAVVTTQSTFETFVVPLFVGGIGFGMIFVPLSVAVLSSVQGIDTQKATSLQSLCQQLGGSIATASLVTLLDRRSAFHLDALAGNINLGSVAVARALQAHASLTSLAALVGRQASTMAFADAFWSLGVVTLALTPLAFFLRMPRRAPDKGLRGPGANAPHG